MTVIKKSKSLNTSVCSRSLYTVHPWQCHFHKDRSEISAYVEASGTWETILNVRGTSGATSEMTAAFVCQAINDAQVSRDLLRNAVETMELILTDGLTFSSEQVIERTVTHLKRAVR